MNALIPETTEVEQEALVLIQSSKLLTIVTHDEYIIAGEHLKAIKRAQKKVEEIFAGPKDAAWISHKEIVAAEKKLLDPLKISEQECSIKVKSYLFEKQKQENLEIERRRKEAESEQKRIYELEKKIQEEAKINLAIQLETQGFKDEANEILNTETAIMPEPIIIPKIIDDKPKVEGVFIRKTYKAQVDNLKLLIDEISAGRQPINLILPNDKILNKMAQALKNELRIPGVSVIEDCNLNTRL